MHTARSESGTSSTHSLRMPSFKRLYLVGLRFCIISIDPTQQNSEALEKRHPPFPSRELDAAIVTVLLV
jgi:hypothetical protein